MVKKKIVISSGIIVAFLFLILYVLFGDRFEEMDIGDTWIGIEVPKWMEENLHFSEPMVLEGGPRVATGNNSDSRYLRILIRLKDYDGTIIADPERCKKILSMFYYSENNLDDPVMEEEKEMWAKPINDRFVIDESRSGNGIFYFNYDGIFQPGDTVELFTGIMAYADWTEEDFEDIGGFKVICGVEGIATKDSMEEAFNDLDH